MRLGGQSTRWRHCDRSGSHRKGRIRRRRIDDVSITCAGCRRRIDRAPVRAAPCRPGQIGCCRHGDDCIGTLNACSRRRRADAERKRFFRTSLLRHGERLCSDRDGAGPRQITRIFADGNGHQIATVSVARVDNGNPTVVWRHAPLFDGKRVHRYRYHMRLVVLRSRIGIKLHSTAVLEHRKGVPRHGKRPLPRRNLVIRRHLVCHAAGPQSARCGNRNPIGIRLCMPEHLVLRRYGDRTATAIRLKLPVPRGNRSADTVLRNGVRIPADIDIADPLFYVCRRADGISDRIASRAARRIQCYPILRFRCRPRAAAGCNDCIAAAIHAKIACCRRDGDTLV